MIELNNNTLCVSFPEVHADAQCSIDFQRTLRIPDDNQNYPLPAGLGKFPLYSVEEFDVPAAWKSHGGVFLPMYQSEALWINGGRADYPFAVKIAAGKINAVTGAAWSDELNFRAQDYVVFPGQRWLDGFNVAKGIVRQFVAARLGDGLSAEEQIDPASRWGGLQFVFYPLRAEKWERILAARRRQMDALQSRGLDGMRRCAVAGEAIDMGLAPGGRIRQNIEKDRFGADAWDTSSSSRCFVHLANSQAWHSITGLEPPTRPFTAREYAEQHVPWFDYYTEGPSLEGSKILGKLDGLAAAKLKQGLDLDDNKPITIAKTVHIGPVRREVRDGAF